MKILHLYYDIMNLYGEYANALALQRILEKNGISCSMDTLSVNDTLSFMEYDFIYVGSGTESNQKIVLEHLKEYREELKSYMDSGKFLLMTGNSFEILGKGLLDADGKVWEGMGIFDFTVVEQDKTRNTADAVFYMEGMQQPLVGFINKCSQLQGITIPLFQVRRGLGNEENGNTEGIRYRNFFGTHLTGPLLVKNPYFLIYIAESLCGRAMDSTYMIYEKAGYEITRRELEKV